MPSEVIISGRVQGVGCRFYCGKVGRALGLHGAATNLGDGTVLVVLETNDLNEAERYAKALRENELGIDFYGRIVSAVARPANHPVSGEYAW
jgi:acylphosphatase